MVSVAGLEQAQLRQLNELVQQTDHNLLTMERMLQQAYGRTWQAKVRTLRRQLRGLQDEVRRHHLEQEID